VQLCGTGTISFVSFAFLQRDIRARHPRTGCIEADTFLDRTAVAATVKADLDAGDAGFLQVRENDGLELLNFFDHLGLPLGVADGKVGHHGLDIDHGMPPVERSQRPFAGSKQQARASPLMDYASADPALARRPTGP
jgi:hypothetical protein